ncbi:unnamed protein product [Nippostrongylus brasiliensis]|uniref:Uncharacterized protein n=1 Tax=Nippostrongylus brasiliensis TaxID=27835 RepID=A0A0N4YXF7_NIPBR|nr:unnamed protein product [Nippostrongylus brasiliensis]
MSANSDDDPEITDPAFAKPLFPNEDDGPSVNNVAIPVLPDPYPNKTRRQLESVEARCSAKAIFGFGEFL